MEDNTDATMAYLGQGIEDYFSSPQDFQGVGSRFETSDTSTLDQFNVGSTFDGSSIDPGLFGQPAMEFPMQSFGQQQLDQQPQQQLYNPPILEQQFQLPQQHASQPSLDKQFANIQLTPPEPYQAQNSAFDQTLEARRGREMLRPDLRVQTIPQEDTWNHWGMKRTPTWAQVAGLDYNGMDPVSTNSYQPTINPTYLSPHSTAVSPIVPPSDIQSTYGHRSRLSVSSMHTPVRRKPARPVVMSIRQGKAPASLRSRRDASPSARSTTSRRSTTISKSGRSRRTSVTSRSQASPVHRCANCGRACKSAELLEQHEKLIHNPDFPCLICNKTFRNATALNHHQITHQARRFPCNHPDCDYAATWEKDLVRHKDRHSEVKKHVCVCGALFTRKDNLGRHQKSAGCGVGKEEEG